jgi:hypothetical protein
MVNADNDAILKRQKLQETEHQNFYRKQKGPGSQTTEATTIGETVFEKKQNEIVQKKYLEAIEELTVENFDSNLTTLLSKIPEDQLCDLK